LQRTSTPTPRATRTRRERARMISSEVGGDSRVNPEMEGPRRIIYLFRTKGGGGLRVNPPQGRGGGGKGGGGGGWPGVKGEGGGLG